MVKLLNVLENIVTYIIIIISYIALHNLIFYHILDIDIEYDIVHLFYMSISGCIITLGLQSENTIIRSLTIFVYCLTAIISLSVVIVI